jgi:hypothetical protein
MVYNNLLLTPGCCFVHAFSQERNTQLAETTAKLQEEKLRLDALLVRQYNLLAILGKQGSSGKRSGGCNGRDVAEDAEGSPSASETSSSKEGLTLGELRYGEAGRA